MLKPSGVPDTIGWATLSGDKIHPITYSKYPSSGDIKRQSFASGRVTYPSQLHAPSLNLMSLNTDEMDTFQSEMLTLLTEGVRVDIQIETVSHLVKTEGNQSNMARWLVIIQDLLCETLRCDEILTLA